MTDFQASPVDPMTEPMQVPSRDVVYGGKTGAQFLLGEGSARQDHADWALGMRTDLRKTQPTLNAQHRAALEATDSFRFSAAMGPQDPAEIGAQAGLFDRYAERSDAFSSQVDWVRYDRAAEAGVLPDEDAELWRRVKQNPTSLADDEAERLFSSVSGYGDRAESNRSTGTTVGLTGKVTRVAHGDNETQIFVQFPGTKPDGGRDRQSRADRVSSLNWDQLGDHGYQMLRKVALIGANEQHPDDYDPSSLLEAFLGVNLDTDATVSSEAVAAITNTIEALAEEFEVEPDLLAANIAGTWSGLLDESGRQGWDAADPFSLRGDEGADNPLVSFLRGENAGPGSLSTSIPGPLTPDVMAASGIKGQGAVTVGDGTVFIAEPTADNAVQARHLTPGLIGEDGLPRWVPSRPTMTENVERFVSSWSNSDQVHVERHLTSELDGNGGHPAFRPEPTIVGFADDDSFKLPPGAGRGQKLGRTQVIAPERDMTPVGPEQIDDVESALRTRQWALVKPEDSNAVRARLLGEGFRPIVQEDGGLLVFGHTGRGLSGEYMATPDGVQAGTPPASVTIDGDVLEVPVSEEDEPTVPGMVRQASRTRSRIEVTPFPGQDLASLASELELRGLSDLSVYAGVDSLEGFQRAYETVVSNGVETVSVRHQEGSPAARNGGQVYVRNARGIPKTAASPVGVTQTSKNKRVVNGAVTVDASVFPDAEMGDGTFDVTMNGQKPLAWGYLAGRLTPIFDEAEAASGRFPAVIRDGKVQPADEMDLSVATEVAQTLQDVGFGDLEVETSKGSYKVASADVRTPEPRPTTFDGTTMPSPRRDRPKQDWVDQFGVEFDPGFRRGNAVHELTPGVQAELKQTMERAMRSDGEAISRFGLSRITVSPAGEDNDQPGFTEARPGGVIVLAREMWEDASMLPSSPGEALAAELGKVLHHAALLPDNMSRQSETYQQLESLTAEGETTEELVSKAYAKVLSGKGSAKDHEVVQMVRNRNADGASRQRVKATW